MNELKVSAMPPNSKDLNPITHLWYILDHIQPKEAPGLKVISTVGPQIEIVPRHPTDAPSD